MRCFVSFLHGKNFQTFLPEYIYFCNKSYPDVDVLVYYTDKLSKKIKKSLSILMENGFHFKLKKISFKDILGANRTFLCPKSVLTSCRWIIEDDDLKIYDEIYLGDLDLMVCKENSNLFDQHRIHSEFIGMPYSDILRVQEKRTISSSFLTKFLSIFKYGFFNTCKFYKNKSYVMAERMTGLRYIKTKEYFQSIHPYIEKYRKIILNYRKWHKMNVSYLPPGFVDEMLNASITIDSFKKFPERATFCDNVCENPNSFNFRPHHGVHMKSFLNDRLIGKCKYFINTKKYFEYFKFYNSFKDDEIYKSLYNNYSKLHKQCILNMRLFYSNVEDFNK